MNEYVETIFHVYVMVFKMTQKANTNNAKLKSISIIIYNYVRKLAKDNCVDLLQIDLINPNITPAERSPQKDINLVPFFEYIGHNNIELYDFNKIKDSDLDVSNNADIERFVLSHIYYLTQNM